MSILDELAATAYNLVLDLFPINRSITGEGFLESLKYIASRTSCLSIHSVPSGTQAYDWTVPLEWSISSAYIEDSHGKRILDFRDNNLHVVGYSVPVSTTITGKVLLEHVHSLPEQANAIPYVTSYYKEYWGYCMTHSLKESLSEDEYYSVNISSTLKQGYMHYGEAVIGSEGTDVEEILFSTYLCHPSMANNELSGPAVALALIRYLEPYSGLLTKRYRFLFLAETIGSVYYISRNLDMLKSSVSAGYVITCVGDERAFSFLPSRSGNTLSDIVARYVFDSLSIKPIEYTWLERGSDERQFCAPGVDLPIASIMRSKYGEYPEYHTSLDLPGSVVTLEGLKGSINLYSTIISAIEVNAVYQCTITCEPMLSKRDLYETISTLSSSQNSRLLLNILTYSDGSLDLLQLSSKLSVRLQELYEAHELLESFGLISRVSPAARAPVI